MKPKLYNWTVKPSLTEINSTPSTFGNDVFHLLPNCQVNVKDYMFGSHISLRLNPRVDSPKI